MQYSKEKPFLAKIKEKVNLCAPSSIKETHHIALDLSGSNIRYEVGDCVAVLPIHSDELLKKTLNALKMTGQEMVSGERCGFEGTIEEFLKFKANLSEINKKVIEALAEKQTNEEKKEQLTHLLQKENREELKNYLKGKQLWDLLSENREVTFEPQEICSMLKPLLPRFYSIASSQLVVGEEVHLTVKKQLFHAHGYEREGVCSHYLCDHAPKEGAAVPIYIHPHRGFTLPPDMHADLIMVGPGTGIAPFRGFMQERIAAGAKGRHWLFFGEWSREGQFLYGDYWLNLEERGLLRLDLAFSRDQEEKHYVQHCMLKQGKELYEWLSKGAYLFVCGDAERMAKDVDAALHEIVMVHGQKSDSEAKEYLRKLRAVKRYLRDVY